MALRLGGVGKQLGMSEADVLGIAAAMSSVGKICPVTKKLVA